MERTILLVDDEEYVLTALRRSLRREGWNILAASDGVLGMRLLQANKVDLVIADMRMPGMDGGAFLDKVRQYHPQVLRVIMTGYTERESVRRIFCQAEAHDMLAKPWDDQELRQLLHELLDHRAEIETHGLQELISRVTPLPVLPQVFSEIAALLDGREEPAIEQVAAAVLREPAVCAKLLQVSNATFFGQRRRVDTVSRAIAVLGLGLTKDLVLASSIFEVLQAPTCEGISYDRLWRHALGCGLVARRLAEVQGQRAEIREAAMLSCMLHDIGKLAMAKAAPAAYAQVARLIETQGLRTAAAERQVLGTTHAEMGGHLARGWNLPLPIVDTVRCHSDTDLKAKPSYLLSSVHLADYCTHRLGLADNPAAPPAGLVDPLLAPLGMDRPQAEAFCTELEELGIRELVST